MSDNYDYGSIGPSDWSKLSVADQANLRAGSPDLSRNPDPQRSYMGSTDHLGPQFQDVENQHGGGCNGILRDSAYCSPP